MTTYYAGQNTVVQRGQSIAASLPAPGSDTFDALPLLSAVKLPALEKNIKEFKTLDSVAARTLGAGLKGMKISFTMVRDFDSAVHLSMLQEAAAAVAQKRNYRVILPDVGAETWDAICFISKMEPTALENESEIAYSVELTLDGNPTITP